MKIGILGTGNVGASLGKRLAQIGHDVIFGSRAPKSAKVKDMIAASSKSIRAGSIHDAVQSSAIVILAVPWRGVKDVLSEAGSLKDKIIIDCTNPLKPDFFGLEVGYTTSAGEHVAQWAKGARVVKAFNSVGSMVMARPLFGKDRAVMFICGDDRAAKQTVKTLAEELGFEVMDAGGIVASRYLEQMAMFWIHLAFQQRLGADFAFKLLRRDKTSTR